MVLKGTVTSGRGDFARWIQLLREHYRRKTDMELFPGTLNVQLPEPYRLPARRIRLEASEYGGTVSVNLVPCRVFGRRAFILRTDANEAGTGHHPLTVLEIATNVKLRDEYGLADGDAVEVEVAESEL
jgi:riboflavin kinase